MSLGFRIASGMALSLALVSAPLSARDYYGGGYDHYHRGGGIGLGGALLGAAIIGSVAIAASNNNRQPVYEQGYDPNTGGEYRSYGGVQNYSSQGYAGQASPRPITRDGERRSTWKRSIWDWRTRGACCLASLR